MQLQSEAQRCLTQLQQNRDVLAQRTKEVEDQKTKSEAITSVAQRQVATLKAQLKQALAMEEAARKQLGKAAEAEAQQQQMQAQMSVLRRKLEQKEQLENAIEGKHSKLTEVYRALESECQAELTKLRERAAHASDPPPEAAVAHGSASCARSLLDCASAMLLAALIGGLAGWLLRGAQANRRAAPVNGSSRSAGGLAVEEMRGWMPVHTADNMKLVGSKIS